MNEQFSRLYHLAWNYALSDSEYQENSTYERRCVVQSRIFAELIVRECVEQVEVFNARMDAGPRHIVAAIKQHFGME